MTDNLEGLSREVLLASAAVEQSAAATALARDHHNNVAERVHALAGKRSAILARRGAGDEWVEDGATLAAITADTENLEAMLISAKGSHDAAATASGRARRAHAEAEAAYKAEENRVALLRLDQHAVDLFKALFKTLAERRAAASALFPVDRALGNVTNRLEALDRIVCAEMATLQGLRRGPAPHPVQPIWKPSDTLYDAVMRLHQVDGHFV